jgi:hypothetical protein
MHAAPFTLDPAATRHLTAALQGLPFQHPGLAICLADLDGVSDYPAHSIDLCGLSAGDLPECTLCNVLGKPLWIRNPELQLLSGRELTLIHAGTPKKRARLIIKDITEHEVRSRLCGGG